MEVAWYLTGLATCCLVGYSDLPGQPNRLPPRARFSNEIAAPRGSMAILPEAVCSKQIFAARIGSFADQVYPTIAFARLSRALNDADAREMALRTARDDVPTARRHWANGAGITIQSNGKSRQPLSGIFRAPARHGADDAVRRRRGCGLRFQRSDL